MAITYVGGGGGSATATAPSADYPTGLTSGDRLFIVLANKYVAPTTPSGWDVLGMLTGGTGTNAAGSGSVRLTVFTKISDGTETGSQTVTITGGNSAVCRMFAVRSTSQLELEIGTGVDSTSGTTFSFTTGSGINTANGDFFLSAIASNSNSYSFSSYAFTQAGVTFGIKNQRSGVGSTAGNDCRISVVTCSVSAGSGSGTVTYSATASGADANAPTGPGIVIRMHDRNRRVFVN
jgi:hypothetical protein